MTFYLFTCLFKWPGVLWQRKWIREGFWHIKISTKSVLFKNSAQWLTESVCLSWNDWKIVTNLVWQVSAYLLIMNIWVEFLQWILIFLIFHTQFTADKLESFCWQSAIICHCIEENRLIFRKTDFIQKCFTPSTRTFATPLLPSYKIFFSVNWYRCSLIYNLVLYPE